MEYPLGMQISCENIASIEKYILKNEPIPFIVDDILVHFDDERSKETLKVLLELSKKNKLSSLRTIRDLLNLSAN